MNHDWMKLMYDRICWIWERLEAEEIPTVCSIWLKYKSEKQEIITRSTVKINTQNKTIDWVLGQRGNLGQVIATLKAHKE